MADNAIRKLSSESNEEMLANEHARRRQPHDTSTGSHTSDQDEVLLCCYEKKIAF